MVRAGIIGGSGYTGGELVRLLLDHPEVEIDFVYSRTRGEKPVSSAHPDLLGITDLKFSAEIDPNIDVVFLCLGHGNSKQFLEQNTFAPQTKIIDLGNDFRLAKDADFHGKTFVYGLPELYKEQIKSASCIANPGCFATAVQLALLPLAKVGSLANEVHINAITGSTGAGVGLSPTSHFSWRNNNVSWYKPFTHQHLDEIGESLDFFGTDIGAVRFLPNRGNFARGIFATAYTKYEGSLQEAQQLYKNFYADAKFTHVADEPVHLKQVVNTNNCHVHLHGHGEILLITSAIDNLLKGASGQAVQNMNLIFNFKEDEGIQLKAGVF